MSGEPELQPERRRLIGDRYELETLIGKGGVGEVWRARHVALNSPVAIKFLQGTSAQKDSVRRRFTTEAQITAQLRTPNAVQVFDFGVTDEGHPYLVMELLEGETLGRRIERLKKLPPGDVVRLLGQCARALQRAHQLGIVHRDFKPENVVISEDDQGHEQVKVLDFGIAKLVGALEQSGERESIAMPTSSPNSSTFSAFTRTGSVLGTPLYMAPEQVKDPGDVDLRADIWAFGVVAYQCLTGRVPFTAESFEVLFERITRGLHTRANFVDETIPSAFDDWFEVACSPDREKRFGTPIIAFRQLAVALGVVPRDDSGSSRMSDPSPAVEERRVLVVPDVAGGGDAGGPTSIGRMGLRTTDRPPPPTPLPSPPPPAVPLAASLTLDTPAPSSPRALWIAVALAAGVVVVMAVWLGSKHGSSPATTSSPSASPRVEPSALAVSPSVEATAQLAPASIPAPAAAPSVSAVPVSSASAVGASRPAPPRPVNTAPRAVITSVATATTAQPAAAPPPAPPSPPTPPPAPTNDPENYR